MQQRPPETINITRLNNQPQVDQNHNYNTTPGRTGAFQMRPHAIQERVAQHSGPGNPMSASSLPTKMNGASADATRTGYDEFGYPVSNTVNGRYATMQDEQMADARRRPPVNMNPTNRLTIANMTHEPEPDTPPAESGQASRFPTAEEEKQRLRNAYNNTGASGSSSNAQPSKTTSASVPPQSQAPVPATSTSSSRSPWPTAEEEKKRLFDSAREQASKTQAQMGILVSSTVSTN